jgi:hypothetical protein
MNITDPARVFELCNALAALTWLALALSPASTRWAPTVRRIAGRTVPLFFAVIYLALLVTHWTNDGGFGSLAEVQRLFAVPGLLTAGWLHYLAFDLFVGAWIAGRAATLRMPHLVLLPLLALTFMFGPVGLLAYALLRASVFRDRAVPATAA